MSTSSQSTCQVIHPHKTHEGKQGHSFLTGICTESVGSQKICMHLLTMEPGAKSQAHMHKDNETAIYVLTGETKVWYGEHLQEHLDAASGDFLFIPAGMPHLPTNPSQSTLFQALIARSDPSEQESVIVLPELEKYVLFLNNETSPDVSDIV